MASQQPHKTAAVAVFLAAILLLASPAAAYRPEAAGATAEATPTEAAGSTPTEASTPAEAGTPVADGYKPGAAATTPAEAPTETADSTPVADGYKPGAATTTPAEAPTETADSTPAEAGTPVADRYKPDAAASTPTDSTPTEASTPAEATPTEASTPAEATPADSTPAEATPAEASTPVAPGYTPAAAGTTPAAESAKATTDVQKLMEMVNAAYKKALEAANAAAPNYKFPAFDAAFDKGIKEGLADRAIPERLMFSAMINKAIKDAYVATSGSAADASEEERFPVFVSTLTEALRAMAASLDAHAVKPSAEEAVAGGAKEPSCDRQIIGKIDAAVKAAADAAKEAPLSDKFLVFEVVSTAPVAEYFPTTPTSKFRRDDTHVSDNFR